MSGLNPAAAGYSLLSLPGAALSAEGTLAGGNFARQAGLMAQQGKEFEAQQLEQNANQAIGSSQREMLDTRLRTGLAISQSRANAAGNGVNAGSGSAVTNQGDIAQRGSYAAAMQLFRGESAASGLRNQAAGARYTGSLEALQGDMQQRASRMAALGTLAGGAGSMLQTYGQIEWPTMFGRGPALR